MIVNFKFNLNVDIDVNIDVKNDLKTEYDYILELNKIDLKELLKNESLKISNIDMSKKEVSVSPNNNITYRISRLSIVPYWFEYETLEQREEIEKNMLKQEPLNVSIESDDLDVFSYNNKLIVKRKLMDILGVKGEYEFEWSLLNRG